MKLVFFQFISGFLSFCLTASVWANIIEYGQKLNEADWKVVSAKKSCKLRQLIPLYGKAEFEQKYSDKGLQFNIYINRVPEKNIKARMTSVPPGWNHVTVLRPLGKVNLITKNKAVSLKHNLSMRVISELEDGMFPTLNYKSELDAHDNIKVSISPINFREQLPKFLACVTSLPLQPAIVEVKSKPTPKTKPEVKPLRESKPIKITKIVEEPEPDTIYFGANSSKLDSKAKIKLKVLAAKLKKDKSKKHIIISGYSDDTGNKTLSTTISKQRAIKVQIQLEKLGIPAKYLFTRYFGRDHSILSNVTSRGRAKNRRVHIDIIKSNLKSPR